jgi:hypothetical protein
MRLLFTLLALFFLSAGAAQAAAVSGTISYAGGGANAASYKKVYLYDSSTSSSSIVYMDSTVTSVSGGYSFTIPSSITSGLMRIKAVTCIANQSGYYSYSGSNLTINITASCLPPSVQDTLRNATSGLPVWGQKVYLKDTSATGSYLDSAYTAYNGLVHFFMPPSLLPGTTLELYTNACGKQSQYVAYAGMTLTAPTMGICVSNAVVSGTVTNGNTSAAIGFQRVVLIDSSGTSVLFKDSTYTASGTGAYSFTIPLTVNGGNMIASTQACGQRYANSASYSGSNLSLNLALCTGISSSISGSVTYNVGSGPASYKKVYLVDSSTLTGTVIYRDSAISNIMGAYTISIPSSITNGSVRIWVNSCGWTHSSTSYTYNGTSLNINLGLGCAPPTVLDTVKNSTNGNTIVGKKVYLLDSSATSYFIDSAYTGQGGLVWFAIPSQVAPGTLKLFSYSCGGRVTQPFTYTGNYDVAPTLLICDTNAMVTGHVSNAITSASIAYQKVILTDSSATSIIFQDSVYTNGSGFYSYGVPLYFNSGTMVASTVACGQVIRNRATFSGSSVNVDLSVCATSSATISGTVTDNSTNAAISGRKVYLIDSNTLSGTIVYRDSTTTNSSGNYSFSIPASVSSGFFKISVPTCLGNMVTQFRTYSGTSLVVNFSVCSSTTPAVLSGTIYVGGLGYAAGTKITVYYFYPYQTISTTTNSSGYYSITLPSNWVASTLNWRDSSGCGNNLLTLVYNQTSLTKSDTLCPVRTIAGTITLQGGGPAVGAKVYLIQQDTIAVPIHDTTLTAVDSTLTNSAGQYSFSRPNGLYATNQLVKAMLMPSHTSYSSYLPTYHDSALMWRAAQRFDYYAWHWGNTNIDISLRGGVNPGGPGFIGGRVSLGANKNVGDPLEDRLIILTTAAGQAVAYTYSDVNGLFSFPNLAYGSYLLFGDVWGKDNPGLSVTLSAGNASITSVLFEENDEKFEGHVGNVGVGTATLSDLSIYPNPARDYVTVRGLSAIKGQKELTLYDLAGKLISRQTVSTGAARLSVTALPAGAYILHVQTEEGRASFHVIK